MPDLPGPGFLYAFGFRYVLPFELDRDSIRVRACWRVALRASQRRRTPPSCLVLYEVVYGGQRFGSRRCPALGRDRGLRRRFSSSSRRVIRAVCTCLRARRRRRSDLPGWKALSRHSAELRAQCCSTTPARSVSTMIHRAGRSFSSLCWTGQDPADGEGPLHCEWRSGSAPGPAGRGQGPSGGYARAKPLSPAIWSCSRRRRRWSRNWQRPMAKGG